MPRLKLRVVNSIEYGLSRFDEIGTAPDRFRKNLCAIRSAHMDRYRQMVLELNLILDGEIQIYNLIREHSRFFNRKRAMFLKGLSNVNKILFRQPSWIAIYTTQKLFIELFVLLTIIQ